MRHSDGLLNQLTCVTILIFILDALLFPSAINSAALWIVQLSVGLIGIPMDPLIASWRLSFTI